MPQVNIYNLSRPNSPPLKAQYCASYLCRLRGLMFRRRLPPGEGLLLVYASDGRANTAIHMLFMLIDLAVVWINSHNEVVDVRLAQRWRLAYTPQRPARFVLELASENFDWFKVGDHVRMES